jgi:hypothetical protein
VNSRSPNRTAPLARRELFCLKAGSTALCALVFLFGGMCGFAAATLAKAKPVSWKSIYDALLRVNDAAPKDWSVYRVGKKKDPLILRLGKRYLLIESHDRKIFELDASKVDRKPGEIFWNPADRPDKPLATSDWVVDDIGAAFIITMKLDAENMAINLQLPHPPALGNLPEPPLVPDSPQ